jgi:hypothetical protein
VEVADEDDEQIINCLGHVSFYSYYGRILLLLIVTSNFFLFEQALTLSKNRVARRAIEVVQGAHVMELERVNAELREEVEQARLRTAEAEERQNSLRPGYRKLEDECEGHRATAETLKQEKVKAEVAHEAEATTIRTKFQDYRVHHCKKLRGL